ncbi:MAG: site-2 protease family protein [Gemmatimonadetes bacterium]|nr:MAG: site-2 protease family protein [Gemmatimonadota bacterium]
MFGKRIDLFRVFGFPVRLDVSWFIVAALIAWSLAVGLFPARYPGLPSGTYWAMGIVGSIALFASIIAHEFSHALVARRHGIPIRGITLFIFGGVSEMTEEPPNARAELLMAAAGPLASVVIAAVSAAIASLGRAAWPVEVTGVVAYLAFINLVLAGFNLLPAFPLDGGRIFRALLWKWKGDWRWATRVAARVGSAFSIAFIVLGVFSVFGGNFIGGMWWFLIGMFLRQASTASYEHVLLRRALEGEPVRRFMTETPVTVPAATSIAELVDSYVYRYHHKLFPVTDDGHLLGCITTRQVKSLPREAWGRQTVGALAQRCGPENSVTPDTDAMQALAVMRRTSQPRLMVVADGRLAGIVTLKDLLHFFALKVELEG